MDGERFRRRHPGGVWCQPATGSGAWSGRVDAGIVGVLLGLGCDVAARGMDPRAVEEGLDVLENCLAITLSAIGESWSESVVTMRARHLGMEPCLPHQPSHPLAADRDALVAQGSLDAWTAIGLAIGGLDVGDPADQVSILLSPCAVRMAPPAPVAALGHVQRPAPQTQRIEDLPLGHEAMLHDGSRMKNSAAFF